MIVHNIRFHAATYVAIAVGLVLVAGCGKHQEAKVEPAAPAPKAAGVSIDAPEAAAPATPPPPPAPEPAAAPAADGTAAGEGQDAPESKQIEMVRYAYFSYCREHTAPPKDISVLVTEHYLKAIPALPSGKRFQLDNKNFKVLVVN